MADTAGLRRSKEVRRILIAANLACYLLVFFILWFDYSRSSHNAVPIQQHLHIIESSPPPPPQHNNVAASAARRDAFVTLLTDTAYIPGAIVLGDTLKRTNTSKSMVCIVTPDVSQSDRATLKKYGWSQVIEIDPISNMFPTRIGKFKGTKVMSKIAVFNLTEVADVIVFIDSDSMVRRNIDHLFDKCPDFCAPVVTMDKSSGGGYFYFNSGLMVLRPNKDLFKSILAFANTPEIPNPDNADMGLLNRFFFFECQNLIDHPIPTTSNGRIRSDLIPRFTNLEKDEYIPRNLTTTFSKSVNTKTKKSASSSGAAQDENGHCMGLQLEYQVAGWQHEFHTHAVVHFLGTFKPWFCFTDPKHPRASTRCADPYDYEQIFLQHFRQLVPDVNAFAVPHKKK